MAMLSFNGSDITPDPSSMDVTIQDISSPDSGRSNTGRMFKIVVAQKRTINVSWNNIQQAQARAIIQKLKSGYNHQKQYVQVTYDGDPEASGTSTRIFYYGDISGAFQQVWLGNRKRYSKLSFTLIEV